MPRKAAAAAAALLLAAGALWMMKARSPRRFELLEARFSCELPAGWALSRDDAADRREGVAGILLTAPSSGPGPAPTIALEYYAPGNSLFAAARDYSARQGPGESRTVAGEPALAWKAEGFAPSAPAGLLGSSTPTRTERVLIGSGADFHLAVLSAPADRWDESEAAFRRLLVTLRLDRRR